MEENTKEMAGTNYQTLELNHAAMKGLAFGVILSCSSIYKGFMTMKCLDMKLRRLERSLRLGLPISLKSFKSTQRIKLHVRDNGRADI